MLDAATGPTSAQARVSGPEKEAAMVRARAAADRRNAPASPDEAARQFEGTVRLFMVQMEG